MSQENVDLVRGLIEAYTREGIGADRAIAYMARWESEWDDLSTVAEEFVDAGDSVVVTVRFSGRGPRRGWGRRVTAC